MPIKLSFNKIKNYFKSKISKKRSNTDKTLVNENKQEKINDPWEEENSWNYEENYEVYEENYEGENIKDVEEHIDQIQIYKVCQFNIFLKYEEYIEYVNENHCDFYKKHYRKISFIEAHSKSYARLKVGGDYERFYKGEVDGDEQCEHRCKSYEHDFNIWVKRLVECSLDEINIIYVYTLDNILKYGVLLI